MSTATFSRTGLANIDDGVDIRENTLQEEHQKRVFDSLVAQGRSQYRQAMQITKSITTRDAEEFEKNSYDESKWNALNASTYEKRIEMISETIHKYTPELIRETCDLETDYFTQILDAKGKGWIDEGSVKWWEGQLKSTKTTHFEKAKLMKEKFPKQLENCRKVAEDRDAVAKLAEKNGLTGKEIPDLAEVLDTKQFLSFTYYERRHKVSKAKALILAYEKKQEKFLSFVEKELESWASEGWMHKTKVGPWMRRVMESKDPEKFASKVLWPFKNNWKKARDRFDAVAPELKKRKDVTRGFDQISATKFLLLDYDKRIAYVEEAESRLESDVNEEGPLAALRLDIRHAMDTGDWEEAEKLLVEARAIDPDDKAVRSMGRYLERNRTDKDTEEEDIIDEKQEQQNKGLKALMSLRVIMSQLPANMRMMTEKALRSSNPNTLKRLWQCFYNRHWVITNGYSTPIDDLKQSKDTSNKEETARRIAHGHKQEFERNTIKNETANDAGIRDECEEPQVLYTNRSGISEVYEGIERNADNAKFGYWTTIVDDEVPYELLREAVLNHMFDIKQNAKILRESGMRYTSHGSPILAN